MSPLPVRWTLLALVSLLGTAADSTIGNVPTDAAYGPIDAVYTWVNGSDPRWQRDKAAWHAKWRREHHEHSTLLTSDENRFRDNDELRYSIRSLYQFAPWIRHVYIVTDGQAPAWLDRSNPHVSIVPHASFFRNASHLPTFASPAIEANLDGIPGLSEYFLYLNDDMLLGAPVSPDDFMSRSGTQNIYLAWKAPACSPDCANWMLGDGVCHRACNTAACGLDHGDCTCASPPVVADDWTPICLEVEQPRSTGCAPGCDWRYLGDDHCQAHCNVAECAFDAGDCDPAALDLLPRVAFNASVDAAAVLLDNHSAVLVVDDVLSVETESSAFVQHAAVLRSRLFLFFNRTVTETIAEAVVTPRGTATQTRLHVVPHGVALGTQGYAFTRSPPTRRIDLAAASISPAFQPPHLDATIYVPFASLPDWSGDTHFTVDDGPAIACPAIDAPSSSAVAPAESHCTLNASGVLLHARVSGNATRASVCLFNADRSSCIVYSAHRTVLAPTANTMEHYALPKTTHECHWWTWCNAAYATLADSCTTASTKALMAKDPSAAKAKAMTLCTRFGATHGPLTRNTTQLLRDKMCRIMHTKDKQPFWLDPCPPRAADAEMTFLDPFGDSLKHVNALFDAAFGKAPQPRRVPSHMPYFIQKRLLAELKAHWPVQFNTTSAHRFRHPKDMQFSFAYMHYVANRRLLHPPKSASELFSSHIDINQNGHLDAYEERNLIGLFPTFSHAMLLALLDDCRRAANVSSALPLRLIAVHCPGLERRLSQVNAAMLPPTHRRMSEEQVTFLMLGRSMTDYVQLYRARSRRTKFVCVNDDITSPSPVLRAMLRDFFELRWSTPSPMERPADVATQQHTVSEKRRFQPTNQLHQEVVDSTFVWPYELVVVGVAIGSVYYGIASMRWQNRSYTPLRPLC
ncbi:hypothetical protein SPRG_15088 [Saprolegnia parasitica CBS 223.65]|uniref:LNR domain-containing protein n=1 Tax=Saprolegnia parasitica (strain CBS 223.65) TaxID=695850 RepID=A0A067BMR8_SAPPC|nr:hypothetical protein SPRG_15088 [Saprolegnia parasitica CBS 223.65]KDO19754.1 hypothetical protein SPRG_15088 [Saprolegnia parasitica CBS 223.65]|eukprot:XP_012209517.1 hypothetical protein SPRG_15088 [Saprolegnia parasitica CBS 223.65]